VTIINAFNRGARGSYWLMEFIKKKMVFTSDLHTSFNIKHLTDPELTRFERTFEHFMYLYFQIIPMAATTQHGYNTHSNPYTISQLNIHYKVQLEKIKAITSNPNFTEDYQRKLQEILTDDKIAPVTNPNRQIMDYTIQSSISLHEILMTKKL
jgi:hypothetical protein